MPTELKGFRCNNCLKVHDTYAGASNCEKMHNRHISWSHKPKKDDPILRYSN